MIDQATIDRVLDAANIVDVVSEFVTLRRRGVNYVGLCPFHADKSPSFYVSPAKNICKCFACGEGGTALHFIMKHEQLSYVDAIRWLAKKYNIEIQERELSSQEKQARDQRESLLIVNTWAQQYFTNQLLNTSEGKSIGMRYFAERGLREETIRKFQLGYSLEQRDALYQAATRAGYKQEYLEKVGLVIPPHANRGVTDRFRGRVIFPVHSLSGKVVAFGGRILKKEEKTAKYVNSPESEIYHKSNELYGIFFAKQAIVRHDRVYLVEGYMDVIGMHQVGVENVVASSGTALTQGQIRLIHRFTDNITVLYDGDAAGIKAALRGIDMLLEEGMHVKVVLLPEGEDPDSYARRGASAFRAYMEEQETDFIRFKTKLLLDEAGNDPIRRTALITDILRSIALIPDSIARSVYIRECSGMMEIDEQVLINEVNKLKLKKEENLRPAPAAAPAMPPPPPPMPEYPDFAGYPSFDSAVNQAPPEPVPAPPPSAEEPAGNADMPPTVPLPEPEPQATPASSPAQSFVRRSPYEAYELALLRYVVRYGEQPLYDYIDEATNEPVVMKVAEYIRYDLERDELDFYTPMFKQMLDEAAARCKEEDFVAHRYFLSHPDPEISRLAANLISDKYQLSQYHSKYCVLETEEQRLPQLVSHDLYAFKDAYILQRIKELQKKIREAQTDMDQVLELMKQLEKLNQVKNVLSKELGERIVLKM